MKRIVICFVAFLFGGPMMLAQLPTGTILGVVKDSSGAVVPGAKVTALETDTGQTRTFMTEADGSYRLDALAVGNYSVTAEAAGFRTEVQNGLALTVGQQVVTNFTMQVGQATQTVSVTTQTAEVDTTTSSLSSLVTPTTIADLPLNGRNYNSLTMLQPGIVQSPTSSTSLLGWQGTQYSSNGSPLRSNSYMLDGAILNNGLNLNGASASGSTLGVDGIEEFRIITNDFDAEYGMHMGNQQVIVTKSGTNQFHGDVFEYLRNSALDARNDFDLPPASQPSGERLPPFRRNQFGGSLGGPIQKNKTFFFGVYEGLRAVLGTTNTDVTLSPGCHGAAGAVITLAACPLLSPVASATIAPQMAPFVALYPLPNLPNGDYGFVFPQDTIEDYGQVRIDHTISPNDSAFARYTVDKASLPIPQVFDFSNTVVASFNQFATLAERHIFSSNLVNTARASYSRTPLGVVSDIINPLVDTPAYQFVPGLQMGQLSVSGLTNLGTSVEAPRSVNQNIFTGSDDIDYIRGHHSLSFGFIFNYYLEDVTMHGYDKGLPKFSSVDQFFLGQLSTFAGFAAGGEYTHSYQYDQMGFYAQDDWRFTPRLTFDLGIRYEPSTTVTDIHGRSAALRNRLTDTTFTLGPLFRNPSLRNWGPRVGFAYDVFGNGKTALRGGFGIMYDTSWSGDGLELNGESDPPFSNPFVATGGIMSVPYATPAVGTFPVVAKGLPWIMNQPHLLSYNMTLEQQLPYAMLLTTAYAGSRGLDLMQLFDGNNEIPTGVPSAAGSGTCVAAPAGSTPNLASQIDGSATSCYLTTSPRMNRAISSLGYTMPFATSSYNALEVNLVKHLSKGLQFQGSYTFGRLVDDGQGEGGGDGGTDFKEPLSEYSKIGPADFDIANVFVLNALYHLPGFTGSKGFESKLTNGWWMGGILSIHSGDPFSVYLSGLRSQDGVNSADGNSTDTADLVPGRDNGNITHGVSAGCGTGATRAAGGTAIAAGTPLHTKKLWYDPCAFSIEPAGFIGTAPRNFMWGPGYRDLDYSLVKDTAAGFLGEGGQIEFRTEFFNILNHPNYGGAGTSVSAGTCGGAVTACTTAVQNPSSSGGVITATNGTSRQIQFALKILF